MFTTSTMANSLALCLDIVPALLPRLAEMSGRNGGYSTGKAHLKPRCWSCPITPRQSAPDPFQPHQIPDSHSQRPRTRCALDPTLLFAPFIDRSTQERNRLNLHLAPFPFLQIYRIYALSRLVGSICPAAQAPTRVHGPT